MTKFHICTKRGLHTVYDDAGQPRSQPVTNKDVADGIILRLERQEKMRTRPCLRCGEDFESEGPHNRLCDICRRLSDRDVGDYAVAKAGSRL